MPRRVNIFRRGSEPQSSARLADATEALEQASGLDRTIRVLSTAVRRTRPPGAGQGRPARRPAGPPRPPAAHRRARRAVDVRRRPRPHAGDASRSAGPGRRRARRSGPERPHRHRRLGLPAPRAAARRPDPRRGDGRDERPVLGVLVARYQGRDGAAARSASLPVHAARGHLPRRAPRLPAGRGRQPRRQDRPSRPARLARPVQRRGPPGRLARHPAARLHQPLRAADRRRRARPHRPLPPQDPLHQGRVVTDDNADICVVCPWHGSTFRVADGSVVHGPATDRQPSFETRVTEEGTLQVRPIG